MLAHGKYASAYLYPNTNRATYNAPQARSRNHAPASKSQALPGAGDNANSRNRSEAARCACDESKRHREHAQKKRLMDQAMDDMLQIATELYEKASPADPRRVAYQMAAQAIAADVARRTSQDELIDGDVF